MAKILFSTPELEYPPRGGPKLRIENSIKALSKIADLIIVSRVPFQKMGGDPAVSFYKKYCKKFLFLTNMDAKYTAKKLMEISSSEDVDLIWLGYGNISYEILHNLKILKCKKPIVVDTDSVWSRFELRGLPFKNDFQEKLIVFVKGWIKRWEEYWGTKVANVTTSVSPFDSEYYRIFSQRNNSVKVFSNVIDMSSYEDTPDSSSIKKPCIYLAGTFGPSSPMEEAALWMIEKVLPLVLKKLPNIHFYIVGVGATEEMQKKAPRNVTITGGVHSVLAYLCHADLAVVPLKYESGTRFKIMEAAACRVPIISTALGAEGIPVRDRHDIMIADTPEDFANAIVEVVKDPELAKKLSENCYQLISQQYSISAAVKQAENIIQSINLDANADSPDYDEHISIISQLVYKTYEAGNAEALLSTSLTLFNYLMEKFGANRCFIEEDELFETFKFLNEAALLFPNISLIIDSLNLIKKNTVKNLAIVPQVVFKQKAQTMFSEGSELMQSNELSPALAKFDEAMYLYPQLQNLQHFRAICLAALQRNREAVFAASAALSTQPDDSLMLNIIVNNLDISSEEIKRAPLQTLNLLDRIVHYTRSKISGIAYLRALCLIALSRLKEALAAIELGRQQNPNDHALKALFDKTTLALQYETQQNKI